MMLCKIHKQTTPNTTPDDGHGVTTDAAGAARSLLLLVVVVKAGVGADRRGGRGGVARQVSMCVCVQECGPRLSGGWLAPAQARPFSLGSLLLSSLCLPPTRHLPPPSLSFSSLIPFVASLLLINSVSCYFLCNFNLAFSLHHDSS